MPSYYGEGSGLIRFYWVLPGFTGFLLVFLSHARLVWGLIEFDQVLLGFTGFY